MNTSIRNVGRLLASCCIGVALPASGATLVATSASLGSVFSKAQAGDTIKLIGSFGSTRLYNRDFAQFVTLDASRASFSDTMVINNVQNLKITGGRWNVSASNVYAKAAVVYGGSNVWFDRAYMTGVTGQQGIAFSGTDHAQVTSSSFNGLRAGVVFGGVTYGTALRNRINGSVSDGIDIADSHFVTASNNSCTNGNPGAGAHPDCIQLWSVAGHDVQSDIIVSNNSASGPTQGFTSFSAGGGGLRIQFTGNKVNTSFSQGVACYNCVDSIISYNTLTTLPGSKYKTNLNVFGGSNNTIVGNVITPYAHPGNSGHSLVDVPADDESQDFGNVVPEPATWAMMFAGFATIGLAMRRSAGPTLSVMA